MEILAKERPQKGRVTVGLSTDQIQCQNHQSAGAPNESIVQNRINIALLNVL